MEGVYTLQDRDFAYRFKPMMLNDLPIKVLLAQAFLADELAQDLALQSLNVAANISEEEFVSVEHDLALLSDLNEPFSDLVVK